MGFPTIRSYTGAYSTDWSSSSISVPLPATVVANDYLCFVVYTYPIEVSGWSMAVSGNAAVYWKIADGTEGGTTVTIASGGQFGAVSFAIAGALDIDVAVSYASSGTINPDPPSNAASWGSAENLYLTACSCAITTVSSGPSGYAFTAISHSGFATVNSTDSSKDPGVFRLADVPNGGAVATIVFKGSSGNSLFFGSNF